MTRNGNRRPSPRAAIALAASACLIGWAGQQAGGGGQEAPPASPTPSAEALARYRAAAERSDAPLDQYNLGTALLLDGQVSEAQRPLQEALRAEQEVVRWSGFYNYGLSTALDGRFGQREAEERRGALQAAREAFREVLRQRPEDEDARWNLELVEHWLEEEEQSGGQGSAGGEADSPGGAGAGAAPSGGGADDRLLSPEEAAALLDQAGQAEASIRDRVMGRNRFRDPAVEKNW